MMAFNTGAVDTTVVDTMAVYTVAFNIVVAQTFWLCRGVG